MPTSHPDTQSKASEVASTGAATRFMALDALRGFDMFWIIGADELVQALHKISDTGVVNLLATQLTHKAWGGFAFYDLIFPMFVFIVGVSLAFSLSRSLEKSGVGGTCVKILRRAVLLYLLGIICYGGLSVPIEKIRLLGVLQRIALCYLFAGFIFCFFKTRGRVIIGLSLLIGYWALMTFVPVPGVGAGNFDEGFNLANYIDKQYLPLRKWDGDHDPEGLLSTLPAIATCLLGVLAGQFMRIPTMDQRRKVKWLVVAGVVLASVGWLWSLQFPVVKKIWTSSFVLVAGGYSCLLLAAFTQVIEVWRFQKWAQPFIWIGMNPITIYLVCHLVSLDSVASRFVGGDVAKLLGTYSPLVSSCTTLLLAILLCRFLYQRKVFIKV